MSSKKIRRWARGDVTPPPKGARVAWCLIDDAIHTESPALTAGYVVNPASFDTTLWIELDLPAIPKLSEPKPEETKLNVDNHSKHCESCGEEESDCACDDFEGGYP